MTSKTMMKRLEQYKDRWTSYGLNTGIASLSDKLSAEQLQAMDLFSCYDLAFLERISPDVSVATWRKDAVLFEEGTYIDIAFFILEGEIEITLEKTRGDKTASKPIFDQSIITKRPSAEELKAVGEGEDGGMASRTMRVSRNEIAFLASMDFNLKSGSVEHLGAGEIFGEIGAMSGWPQSVTARVSKECRMIQVRVPALRLMKKKSRDLKARIDKRYRERSLLSQLKTTPLFGPCSDSFLMLIVAEVDLVSCNPDDVIVSQGEDVDALYMVRSGFVKLTQAYGEGEMVVSYLSKGMTFGEVEFLMDGIQDWESTAISVEYAELVRIPLQAMKDAIMEFPDIEERLWETASHRIKESGFSKRNIRDTEFKQVALDTGLVQGNSVLVIDLNHCTRCDDCVRACASTHDGRPRFVREGQKLDNLLVAKSCYHCKDPVCLVGCPTGAIHRAGIESVIEIADDVCIGCATCSRNCPYDAIVMHETGETWSMDMVPEGLRGKNRKVASKCDQCASKGFEPACVSHCPQGCATRVSSLEEFQQLFQKD